MSFLRSIFVCLALGTIAAAYNDPSLNEIIAQLGKKVDSYQVLKEQNYTLPPHWYEKLGLYRSEIRLNLFGNPLLQEFRTSELTAIFDNDMFSSGWIITALLEATQYGKGAPQLDHNRLQLALEAIGSYHNHNDQDYDHDILRTFWPQKYNATTGLWYQQPVNIFNVASFLNDIPFGAIETFLKKLKLDKLIPLVDGFKQLSGAVNAFCIPPDFDDTYLNLGIGATLSRMTSLYPKAYSSWLANNTDVAQLINATVKYSYKPLDADVNSNVIDPRTFFWARNFVQEAHSNNDSVSLITTWIQNIGEQRAFKTERINMPFNLNNVDVTVAANSIYGITSASLFNLNNFGDLFVQTPELIQTYLNSTRFITWAIHSNFSGRPDLAQVYYPSTYNFLWYASRTLFLLTNQYNKYDDMIARNDLSDKEFVQRLASMQSVFLQAKSYLEDAFKTTATEYLFAKKLTPQPGHTYFRDFIGLNDTTVFGKPVSNDEDALFTTAQAINILIATWTYQRLDNNQLAWKSDTPNYVRDLLDTSVNWLKENVLGTKYKPYNAFFSGSVKGLSTLPFWYPTNFDQFLNGTFVTDEDKLKRDELSDIINGVQGSIDEPSYQAMLTQTHFNYTTPLEFTGYNIKNNIFPFWSSQPYTYAVSLLALSQFNNLE
jgi:hypothetical protein